MATSKLLKIGDHLIILQDNLEHFWNSQCKLRNACCDQSYQTLAATAPTFLAQSTQTAKYLEGILLSGIILPFIPYSLSFCPAIRKQQNVITCIIREHHSMLSWNDKMLLNVNNRGRGCTGCNCKTSRFLGTNESCRTNYSKMSLAKGPTPVQRHDY